MNDDSIQPLPLRRSLPWFGIPAAVGALVVYVIMPAVGEITLINYLVTYATIPMLALMAAALIAYRREGNALTWPELKQRFRLERMAPKMWLWALGLVVFMVASAAALSFTAGWIGSLVSPPSHWPDELNPLTSRGSGGELPTAFMGVTLAGNWWVPIAMLASLVIATLGEELWWRGYILPRQEKVHGSRTWVMHGLMWAGFHVFMPWNLISILPGALALSYVAQRTKSTSPGIIAHGLANGLLVLIVVVLGAMG